jgi:Zn-dependent peptidase ImmA (M78 family)/transcriptional regulator with XRE-family HTH domain
MSTQTQHERIARRIKALREERCLTQAQLSEQLGIRDRQTLAAIEAGERRVNADELLRVAQALGVDVDTFLDPFRLIGEGAFSFRAKEVAEPVLAAFEEQARRWIATYRELALQAGAEPRRLGQKLELYPWSSFEDAAAAADVLQEEWLLGSVPADRLNDAIENRLGALVLYVDAAERISGAASQLPGLQAILVNRREPGGRRSFDLAHELFHLLTWDAMPPRRAEPLEVRPTRGNRVEQMAEIFASELLMPAPVVVNRWAGRGSEGDAAWVERTAAELKVSVPALAWRMVNLGYFTRSEARAMGESPRRTVPHARQPPPPLFSRPFVERVSTAVEAGRLSLRRAAGLLDLSAAQLVELCADHGHPLSYEVRGERVLLEGTARKDTVVLVDTNVIMEAVRTHCWNAVAGGLRVKTVEEWRDEAMRGDRGRPGYVPVSEKDLARLRAVHPVSALERATFALAYEGAQNMDPGERDLFAHAHGRVARGDDVWILCSADRACVRAAVALGWHERLARWALGAAVGANPHPPLLRQHGESWLSQARTEYLLRP